MVVTHPSSGDQLCIGVDLVTVPKLKEAMETAEASGCDFVISPLVHPRYDRVWRGRGVEQKGKEDSVGSAVPPVIARDSALTRPDLELNSGEWIDGVIGKFSSWLRPDSTSERMRKVSEEAFLEEFNIATHLSLRAVVTPMIDSRTAGVNFARCILSALEQPSPTQILVRVPVSFTDLESEKTANSPSTDMTSWELWNHIRTLCNSHPNLRLALELTHNLPSKNIIERWFAEPVQMLLVSTSAFVTNKHGYSVLQRRHKDFITSMFRYKCQFAISGRVNNSRGPEGLREFVMFLAYLFGKQPGTPNGDVYDAPYLDYLQTPLQPLAHNLESSVYETFEKDPTKYARYQAAIRRFLMRRSVVPTVPSMSSQFSVNTSSSKLVAFVLGAGRGPLVRACMAAAEEAKREVFIYAVEKNPNAVIALQSQREAQKWTNVKIVAKDMRDWEPPEKADVIISELLGSFGDNELSPECLRHAKDFLKEDGVCIPQNSVSYLAPLCSPSLHANVNALGTSRSQFETPYVVKIHRGITIDKEQECFRFDHPDIEAGDDYSRYRKLKFQISETQLLHGFAGYFEAQLFEDIDLSIRPETHTAHMFSWYPVYFPLRNSILLPSNSKLVVHIWRRTTPLKVWYEWCVSSPIPVAVHNVNGRSSRVDLSTS